MVEKRRKTITILFKDLLRTLKNDWKQFISIIAISCLSVCLFAGLIANANKLDNRTQKLYEESNYADIYITNTSKDPLDLENIKNLEGVQVAEERTYMPVEFGNDGINIIVSDPTNDLTHPVIVEGEMGYLAMTKFMDSEKGKYEIGENISIIASNILLAAYPSLPPLLDSFVKDGGTNVLKENKITLSFAITGTMYHPEGVQNSSFSSSLGYMTKDYLKQTIYTLMEENYDIDRINAVIPTAGYESLDAFIKAFIDNTNNQILINTNENTSVESVINSIRDYYNSKENKNLMLVTEKEYLESYQMLNQDVTQAGQLPYVFPIIFFLVSVLVILTTVSQMIIKERSQIGSLKATGVPHVNIYLHYMSLGSILTLLGGLLGMILGPIIIPPVMGIKYNLLWDLPKVATPFISWQGVTILVSMVIITVVCAFFVSRSVIKEKPVLTLRPKVAKTKKKLTNPNNFFYKHTKLSIRMAYRNISKNKAKTVMVMLGTLGCAALAVCGFGIMDTLNYGIDHDYTTNVSMEISAQAKEANANIEDRILEIEGVDHAEAVSSYAITLTSDTTYLVTSLILMEENTRYFPALNETKGVNLDKTTANNVGVKVGDEITVTVGINTYTKTVERIFESSLQHGIYDLFINYQEESNASPTYYIYGKENVTHEQLKQGLEDSTLFDTILTYEDMMDRAHEIMSSIELMTNVVKIFAILLCIVVIYNLTSLNISERTRDIATMKVLGFKFGSIATTLTTELMIDTVIGALLGLLFGFPMTYLVLSVNITSLLTFMYHVYWYSYIYGFLLTAGTAFIVSFLLNHKIKKIKMVESLKSIE